MLRQTGGRFSAKAVAPSIASPLSKTGIISSIVRAQPSASVSSAGLAHESAGVAHRDGGVLADALGERDRLVDDRGRRARPGSRARVAARVARRSGRRSSRARARSRAGRASAAGSGRRPRPSARASPRGCRSARVSAATTRSHDSTISKPPASAGPLTAAMIGLGKSRVTMPAKPPLPRAMSFASPCGDDLEVGAGREHLAPPGQHDRAQRGVGFDLVEQRGHRLAHLGADRVAGLGPVQRDERDVLAPFEFDDCHGSATLIHRVWTDVDGRSVERARDARAATSRVRRARAAMIAAAPNVVARSPTLSAIFPCSTAPSGYSAPRIIVLTDEHAAADARRRAQLRDRRERRRARRDRARRRRGARAPRRARFGAYA